MFLREFYYLVNNKIRSKFYGTLFSDFYGISFVFISLFKNSAIISPKVSIDKLPQKPLVLMSNG